MDNKELNNELVEEMNDEKGEKVKVEIVKKFTDGNKQYVIANDLSNDTDSYILELRMVDNENIELLSVDDEKEFERLCEIVDNLED